MGSKCDQQRLTLQASGTCKRSGGCITRNAKCLLPTSEAFSRGFKPWRADQRATGCGREKEGSRVWGCLNPQLWLEFGSSLLATVSFTHTLLTVLGSSLPVSSTSRVSVLSGRLSFSRVIVCCKAKCKNLKLWIHVSFPSWEVARALQALRHP